jgi:hypothetical protein
MTINTVIPHSFSLAFAFGLSIMTAQLSTNQDTLITPPDTTTVDSLLQDYQSGLLTLDQYYLYLTFSIFTPDSLPTRYQTYLLPREATPIIREVKRIFPRLRPETQARIRTWIKPLPPKPIKERPK